MQLTMHRRILNGWFYTWWLCLMPVFLHAQSPAHLDSLKQVLATTDNDSVKLKIFSQLGSHAIQHDLDAAPALLQEGIALAKESGIQRALGVLYSNYSNYFIAVSQYDSSNYYEDAAIHQFLKLQDTATAAILTYNKGAGRYNQQRYKEAIAILESNLPTLEQYKDTLHIAASTIVIGNSNKGLGYHRIALEKYYAGIKLHEKLGRTLHLGDAYLSTGFLLELTGDTLKALEFKQKAVDVFAEKESPRYLSQAMTYLGLSLAYNEQFEKAKAVLEDALRISLEVNYPSNIARTYHFIGSLYSMQNLHEAAESNYIRAIELYTELGLRHHLAGVQMTLGETYLKQGNFIAAKDVIEAALATGEAMEHPETMQIGYKLLAKIHDKLGNHRLAYTYLKQYQNISDSLFNIEQQKAIEELTIIHETEQKEAALALQSEQIINLNQAVRIQALRKTLFGAGFIAVLFILALTFFAFQQKLRNRTIAQRAKEAQFQQEIDFKQKELTSQTLHLVRKNTFLQDLKQKLEASQSSPATFEKETNKILSSLNLEPELDKDWEMFKSYFTEIHNDFDQKLLAVCPDITDNEMRLACLIKMKLNTAEIGAMLHVMPESIRKSKYRLKKKLGLAKEQELYQYLLEL